MKFYIKQKIFSIGEKFTIYDENGNDAFYVEGEFFTLGRKFHLLSALGYELSYIEQKLFSFLPKYYIYRDGQQVAEVIKEFTFFRQAYTVEGLGYEVEGDFFAHEYSIYKNGYEVASVSKEWFTFGDAYELDIASSEDAVNLLSIIIVIDACIESSKNNN